jgi:hypothetical protein
MGASAMSSSEGKADIAWASICRGAFMSTRSNWGIAEIDKPQSIAEHDAHDPMRTLSPFGHLTGDAVGT